MYSDSPAQDHLCDESSLKASVQALASSSGLGTVSKDQVNGEMLHGDFKMGFLNFRPLLDMGSAVAGGSELAGHVQVEGGGKVNKV